MELKEHESFEEQNLMLANTIPQAESLVASFYGKFPYPWRPYSFEYIEKEDHYTRMINQELGFWHSPLLPYENQRIWVAGCGTNQAIVTALRFPHAMVIGSDLSTPSLEVAQATADAIGLKNVQLRQESIMDVSYTNEFDYILCTGVIHHNAEPEKALAKLAKAIKVNGVIELMVYNRYHRMLTSAFQQAVRLLNPHSGKPDYDADLFVAKELLKVPEKSTWMEQLLSGVEHQHDGAIADALINPVEHSYTVKGLAQMANACDLRLASPCLNAFDQTTGDYVWDIHLENAELQEKYEALPDVERWNIANLVCFEKSPMLWFYLQKNESNQPIPTTQAICDSFLSATFHKNKVIQRNLLLSQDGSYQLSPKNLPLPAGAPHESIRDLYHMANEEFTMRDLFTYLRLPQTLATLNLARLRLTTTHFPYLITV